MIYTGAPASEFACHRPCWKAGLSIMRRMLCVSVTAGIAAIVLILLPYMAVLASLGVLQLPLPAPAHGKHASLVPDEVYKWQPRSLEGEWALNDKLKSAVRLFEGKVHGSESVAVGPEGELVLLDRYNNVYEAVPNSKGSWKLNPKPVAQFGAGRPLGFHFESQGNLLVCDSLKGLLEYNYYDVQHNQVNILATHVSENSAIDPGSEITYANDLAIASDGTVYFTSCTDVVPPLNHLGYYDTYRAWFLSLMKGEPKGRLMKYDPHTGEVHVIAKGFYYANGVALSDDESFVVVAETDRIRAHKVWLQGDKAGQVEVFIDRLPGMPDGVDPSADGGFWISLVAPAPPFESVLLSKYLANPFVRALYAWMPAGLRPRLKSWGAVVKVDDNGQLVEILTDPTGETVSTISAVSEAEVTDDRGNTRKLLFLGNLVGNYVSYVELNRTQQ